MVFPLGDAASNPTTNKRLTISAPFHKAFKKPPSFVTKARIKNFRAVSCLSWLKNKLMNFTKHQAKSSSYFPH